jgi:hypothetical protein
MRPSRTRSRGRCNAVRRDEPRRVRVAQRVRLVRRPLTTAPSSRALTLRAVTSTSATSAAEPLAATPGAVISTRAPGSAGVAAVQQIALTKWDWATLLKRVGLINTHLTPRAPPSRNPRVPPPPRVDTLHAAAFIALLHLAPLRVLVGRHPRVLPPLGSRRSGRSRSLRAFTALLCALRSRLLRSESPALHLGVRRGCARAMREAARVVTAWDAEVLATARAAWVASAWVAWRAGRVGRAGRGRENFSA